MTRTRPQDAGAGKAVYNPVSLRAYDAVMEFNCRFVFNCSKRRMMELYDSHIHQDHLDLGVGTGYFLDRCRKSTTEQHITLADLNEHALAHAARRLARYSPTTYRVNALEKLPFEEGSFGSASTNCMLHCVPGDITAKASVFDHLAACVRPGGTLFGSTVLSRGVPLPFQTRAMFRLFNSTGMFHNADDDLDALSTELAARFPRHTLSVQGCVALFTATVD